MAVSALLILAIVLGSRMLHNFDSALLPYAVATVFLAFGVAYRYTVWISAPGARRAFRYPSEEDRAVAVRLDDGTLVGYSAVCTHLACAVLWRKDRGTEGELYCPCHEGVFDARSGEVTAGPPPRGLPKVVVIEQDDGSVWAVGTTRSGESIEKGLCRQLGGDRPDLASRIGCPDIGGGAESPPRAAGARARDRSTGERPAPRADSGTESGRRATGPADGPGRRAGGPPATAENPGRRA